MRWAEGFIAVDWGTTNRRAYLMDAGGSCVDEFEDDKGILSRAQGRLRRRRRRNPRAARRPAAAAGRHGRLQPRLGRGALCPLPRRPRRPGRRPGLAGGGRTAIVPGVSFVDPDEADVMRGEEVQILGAVAAGIVPADSLVCHPGTHNKWARLTGGRIERFRTVMTGELFNLLASTASSPTCSPAPRNPGDAFEHGVRRGLADECLTAELFEVRARVLLGEAKAEDAASFVSGLLIGDRRPRRACGRRRRRGRRHGPAGADAALRRGAADRRAAGARGRRRTGFLAGAMGIAEAIG